MTPDLLLDSVNTHLALRQRIRVALEGQRQRTASIASLTQATPEQLRELSAAVGVFNHLQGNRQRYAEHVASLTKPKPTHYNSLASLGHQIEEAQARVSAATDAVYRSVAPNSVTEDEVEGILKTYCETKGVVYDPSR